MLPSEESSYWVWGCRWGKDASSCSVGPSLCAAGDTGTEHPGLSPSGEEAVVPVGVGVEKLVMADLL